MIVIMQQETKTQKFPENSIISRKEKKTKENKDKTKTKNALREGRKKKNVGS